MKKNCPFLSDKATPKNAREYSRSLSSPPRSSMGAPPAGTRKRGWSEHGGHRLGSASDSGSAATSGKSYSGVTNTGVNKTKVIDNRSHLGTKSSCEIECFACGGSGHMKRNCPFLIDDPTSNAPESFSSPPRTDVVSQPSGDTQKKKGWLEKGGGHRLGSASDSGYRTSAGKTYSCVTNTGVNTKDVTDDHLNLEINSSEVKQDVSICKDKVDFNERLEEDQAPNLPKADAQLDSSINGKIQLSSNGVPQSVTCPVENGSPQTKAGYSNTVKTNDKEETSSAATKQASSQPSLEKRKRSHYPPFIDTHCHLEYVFERYHHRGSFQVFANRFNYPTNFEGCISTFCDPAAFSSLGSWAELLSESNVWGAFGVHPHNAKYFHTSGLEDKLLKCLQHPKCVAFGEIGLDYSDHSPSDPQTQKDVLRHQLQLVVPFGKPLILHCRDAEQDLFQILAEKLPRDWFIHLHCFTGKPHVATQFMEHFPNLYLGVCGNVTNPRQVNMRTVASSVPLERLLIETDAPYHVPSNLPRAGWCRNSHPALAFYVAKEISNIRKTDLNEILKVIRSNTRTIYGV